MIGVLKAGKPAAMLLALTLAVTGLSQAIGTVPQRILIKFNEGTPSSHSRASLQAVGCQEEWENSRIGVKAVRLPQNVSLEAALSHFRQKSNVEFVEADAVLQAQQITPNDPFFVNWEWHLNKISCPAAWSLTTGSSSVVIAVLDTGVEANHPDLAGRLVPGWNVYSNNADITDYVGHGTSVAGVLGAASNNGLGVAAVTWGCKVMPIKVTSGTTSTTTYSVLANALTWAADHGAKVANVSFDTATSSTFRAAAQYFQSRGGVVVVSAGNSGVFVSTSSDASMMTVSATTHLDVLTSYSNYGNLIDIAAPGSTYSTIRGGQYYAFSGTSAAAPIVAGVAALVFSANPLLSGLQARQLILDASDDLGEPGWDRYFGRGRLNALRAVELAMNGGGPTDTEPPSLSFMTPSEGATVSGVVNVSLSATDNQGVESVSLSIDGVLVASLSSSPYSWNWDTRTYSNGAHNLTASARDQAGNTTTRTIAVAVANQGDTTAPSVQITSPSNGVSVSGNVTIAATASDNVGVTRVDFFVDGIQVGSSTLAPFTYRWNARKASAGQHSLQCRARDAAGNIGCSETISVTR